MSSPLIHIEIDLSEVESTPPSRPAMLELVMPAPAQPVPLPMVDDVPCVKRLPSLQLAVPAAAVRVPIPFIAETESVAQPEPAAAARGVGAGVPQAWYEAEAALAEAMGPLAPPPRSPLSSTLAALTSMERTAFQPALAADRAATGLRRAAGLRLRLAQALDPGSSLPPKPVDALLAELDGVLTTLHSLEAETESCAALEAINQICQALAGHGEDLLATTSVYAERRASSRPGPTPSSAHRG
ncbi:MAG: hypothetical protein JST54_07040 [Deltaproteobacteria bacterium]|nr:hypothetical protein [Deltaproteobacteria bacterium]